MKKWSSLLFLALIIAACGNDETGTHRGGIGGFEKHDSLATQPSPNGSQYLTIHGKDIWVRDSSSTGPVIMKLNEGDRCEYLDIGHMEIIHGNADYWYNVRYQGKDGWVFGSQTDWKGRNGFVDRSMGGGNIDPSGNPTQKPEFRGETAEQAWNKFKEEKMKICAASATTFAKNVRRESYKGYECKITEMGGLDFKLREGAFFTLHEPPSPDFYEETYWFVNDTVANLWFSGVGLTSRFGGPYETTILGTHDQDWELHGVIDGRVVDRIALGRDTMLFAFHWGLPSSIMEEEGVSIWRSIRSQHSFQQIQRLPFPGCFVDPDKGCIHSFESADLTKVDGQPIELILHYEDLEPEIMTWNPSLQAFKGDHMGG